jgi:RNA polymerase sigma-70 factor (ECF subfamily)
MSGPQDELETLVRGLRDGGAASLGELFVRYRDRLRWVVAARLDPRLRGRIDPSDVLQETFLEAMERFETYRREPAMPLFLWLRFLAVQRLLILHRRHFRAKRRDAAREVAPGPAGAPEVSAADLAERLIGHLTSPSDAAIRAEQRRAVLEALNALEPIDREVLVLRHFEQLSNAETAQLLGLRESAASNRYVRALQRLRAILDDRPAVAAETSA